MRIATTMASIHHEKYQRDIPDDTAFNFVYLIEQGVSVDALVESLMPEGNKGFIHRGEALKRLVRNKHLRNSALFCALAGVKQIPLN